MFTLYDLIGFIYTNAPSIKIIHLPISVTAYFRDPISLDVKSYTITDDYSVIGMFSAMGVTNRQVTNNTIQWYIGEDDITINLVSVIS
jgi:hypothetical protein